MSGCYKVYIAAKRLHFAAETDVDVVSKNSLGVFGHHVLFSIRAAFCAALPIRFCQVR